MLWPIKSAPIGVDNSDASELLPVLAVLFLSRGHLDRQSAPKAPSDAALWGSGWIGCGGGDKGARIRRGFPPLESVGRQHRLERFARLLAHGSERGGSARRAASKVAREKRSSSGVPTGAEIVASAPSGSVTTRRYEYGPVIAINSIRTHQRVFEGNSGAGRQKKKSADNGEGVPVPPFSSRRAVGGSVKLVSDTWRYARHGVRFHRFDINDIFCTFLDGAGNSIVGRPSAPFDDEFDGTEELRERRFAMPRRRNKRLSILPTPRRLLSRFPATFAGRSK